MDLTLDSNSTSFSHSARTLTQEEIEKLKKDSVLVTEFKQLKLENEAQKNWDLFYKRNSTNFFKDRHWTIREFEDLAGIDTAELKKDRKSLLEVGCGVGNFIFPLINQNINLFIYACDFSSRAINFVKENPLYCPEKCFAFQCDITKQDLNQWIQGESVDIVSLIFVLSSLHPNKMSATLRNIRQIMKPGGVVLFRDYGLYDQAMLRFSAGHKLMERFYVRQDGTRAYYFSEEELAKLFEDADFEVASNHYVRRQTVNYKEDISVPRVFIQGKFVKKPYQ